MIMSNLISKFNLPTLTTSPTYPTLSSYSPPLSSLILIPDLRTLLFQSTPNKLIEVIVRVAFLFFGGEREGK